MRPPSRSRRIAKWTGLVVSVLFLAFSVALTSVFDLFGRHSGPIDWLHVWLVLMFPVAAVPTAILWRRDRRTLKSGGNLAMRPAFRFRRIAKWTGLVVCVVILAMWVTSVLRPFMLYTPFGGVLCSFGVMGFLEGATSDFPYFEDLSSLVVPIVPGPRIWHETLGLSELPTSWRMFGMVAVMMPLWLPFIAAAIPTALLWYRDRRRIPRGHCRTCGYDLRASKKTCPECGTAVANPTE